VRQVLEPLVHFFFVNDPEYDESRDACAEDQTENPAAQLLALSLLFIIVANIVFRGFLLWSGFISLHLVDDHFWILDFFNLQLSEGSQDLLTTFRLFLNFLLHLAFLLRSNNY